ncbi:MAG: amidase family protein, partial [Sulfitobacter sp.]|nr:amidase family protein [Sulfitobacter sp.]
MENTPQSLLEAARARATTPDFTCTFHDPVNGTGPLSGLNVAVKDLFNVRGYVTRAGSVVRNDMPLATEDAQAVA